MNYEEMTRETNRIIREAVLRDQIGGIILGILAAAAILFWAWLRWQEHKAQMRRLQADQEWQDVRAAMGGAQYGPDGQMWYRQ